MARGVHNMRARMVTYIHVPTNHATNRRGLANPAYPATRTGFPTPPPQIYSLLPEEGSNLLLRPILNFLLFFLRAKAVLVVLDAVPTQLAPLPYHEKSFNGTFEAVSNGPMSGPKCFFPIYVKKYQPYWNYLPSPSKNGVLLIHRKRS